MAAATIDLVAATPLLGRMWELRHNVTGYDSAYLAVAETLGCALVTADARLSQVPGLVAAAIAMSADPCAASRPVDPQDPCAASRPVDPQLAETQAGTGSAGQLVDRVRPLGSGRDTSRSDQVAAICVRRAAGGRLSF